MKKYFLYWKLVTLAQLQEVMLSKFTSSLFFLGKSIRLTMMIIFLLLLKNRVKEFAGYNSEQILVFFLTYNFIDLVAQIFFRSVYNFTNKIKRGELDQFLIKPISPLVQALTGGPDPIDAIFLIPVTLISIYLLSNLNINYNLNNIIVFIILFINSLILATAIHIIILAAGILITEIDHLVWLWRDISRLGQFPVDIYFEPLRFILFFIVPIGLMVTIPAQALSGHPTSYGLLPISIFSLSFIFLSWKLWQLALKKYSSASS